MADKNEGTDPRVDNTTPTLDAQTGSDQATVSSTANGNAQPGQTFAQADVDRIVKDRLTRERQKYPDYDDLKAKAAKFQELEDAKKSESEKLNEQLAQLQEQNARLQVEQKQTLIRSAVISEAQSQGFMNPADAYQLLDKTSIEIDDEGQVAGAKEALETLAKDKSYLLQTGPTLGATNPGRGGQRGETDDEKRKRIFGGGGADFTDLGGGVYMPAK